MEWVVEIAVVEDTLATHVRTPAELQERKYRLGSLIQNDHLETQKKQRRA